MYRGSNIIVHQIQNFLYLLYIILHQKMPGNEQLQISSPPILNSFFTRKRLHLKNTLESFFPLIPSPFSRVNQEPRAPSANEVCVCPLSNTSIEKDEKVGSFLLEESWVQGCSPALSPHEERVGLLWESLSPLSLKKKSVSGNFVMRFARKKCAKQ